MIAPLAALAVIGCNQNQAAGYKPEPVQLVTSATLNPGEERRLFPMVRGNQWVYDVEIRVTQPNGQQEMRTQELTFRCTNVVRQGNRTTATLEAVMDGQVNERQQWVFEEGKGLFQASVGYPPKPFTPMQAALRFPIQKDNVFKWEGTGFVPEGSVKKSRTESKIEGNQEVDTGVGRMEAVTVQTTSRWDTGVAAQTTWWAPDIGIARYRQEVRVVVPMQGGQRGEAVAVSVMRLKSKSLKSASE